MGTRVNGPFIGYGQDAPATVIAGNGFHGYVFVKTMLRFFRLNHLAGDAAHAVARHFDWNPAMLQLADGATTRTTFKKRVFEFRLGRWCLIVAKEKERAPEPDIVTVSAREYARLEECTNNPERPTQGILNGAELLKRLRAVSR